MWNTAKNTLLCVALVATPGLAQRDSDPPEAVGGDAKAKVPSVDKEKSGTPATTEQVDRLRRQLEDLKRKFGERRGVYSGGGIVRDPAAFYKSQFRRQIDEQQEQLQQLIENHGEDSKQVKQTRERLDRLKRQWKFFNSEGDFEAKREDFRGGAGREFSGGGFEISPDTEGRGRGFFGGGPPGRPGAPDRESGIEGAVSPNEMRRQFEKIMEQMMRFSGPRGERMGGERMGGEWMEGERPAPALARGRSERSVVSGLEAEIETLANDIRTEKEPAERKQMALELRDLIETANQIRSRHRRRQIAKLERELSALREAEDKKETVEESLQRLIGRDRETR